MKLVIAVASLAMAAVPLIEAQSIAPRRVRAIGTSTISAKPDRVKLNVGVITEAATAQDAAQQNATLLNAVLTRLRAVLPATADIQTLWYSISPKYTYPQNQAAVLTGYTVTNTLEVTSPDLAGVGAAIDAANAAGANTVQNLSFTLADDDPVRQQALAAAAKQARAHADAIASGLGGHTGTVVVAQEGSTVTPSPVIGATAGAAATTPIVAGPVQVQATVTIEVELTS